MTSAAMARRVRLPRRAVHSVTLLLLAFSTALLLQPAGAQSNSMTPRQPLTPQAFPWATPPGVSWALIENYDNGNASRYGNPNTTLCECLQACLDLPGCSGFDYYTRGHNNWCWLGTNCPVVQPVLEYDQTNSHYVPLSMVHCYPTAMWAYESTGTLLKTSSGVLFVGLITALKFVLKN